MVMQYFQLLVSSYDTFLALDFPHSYNSVTAPADLGRDSLQKMKLQISPLICETEPSEI